MPYFFRSPLSRWVNRERGSLDVGFTPKADMRRTGRDVR
jgi:hypothetical protein